MRKEKVDRSKVNFSELQPLSIHFDGSVSKREVAPGREYTMELWFARPGDIVVAKIDLKNGAVGIVPEDWQNVAVTGHFAVYEPDRSKLLPEFFHRVIQTSFFKANLWRNKVGAEGRKEVKLDFFESALIPLPPVAEQRAIVERWRSAQAQIAAAHVRVAMMESKIPQIIYDSLGTPTPAKEGPKQKLMVLPWEELERWSFTYLSCLRAGLLGFTQSHYSIARLGDHLIETRNGYCIKPVSSPTPHRMLKLSALKPGGLELSESKFIRVPDSIADRFHIRQNDLLICRSNAFEYVAKCSVVTMDHPDILFPDIMICGRLKPGLLPAYACEVINTPLCQRAVKTSHEWANQTQPF